MKSNTCQAYLSKMVLQTTTCTNKIHVSTSVSFFCGQNKIPQVKINSLMLPIANGLCDNLCFVCLFAYLR